MSRNKGFTLIELIIVIALIAILATTVILVINPVKIFQEARDSQRIADLGQMNSALSLYASTASSPAFGTTTNCYVYVPSTITWGTVSSTFAGSGNLQCQSRYGATTAVVTSSVQTVAGSGWIPVALSGASGGSPLAAWPVDPKTGATASYTTASTTSFYYSYIPGANSTWELDAHMESARYAASGAGADDVESTDGGNRTNLLEIGTDVNL